MPNVSSSKLPKGPTYKPAASEFEESEIVEAINPNAGGDNPRIKISPAQDENHNEIIEKEDEQEHDLEQVRSISQLDQEFRDEGGCGIGETSLSSGEMTRRSVERLEEAGGLVPKIRLQVSSV